MEYMEYMGARQIQEM